MRLSPLAAAFLLLLGIPASAQDKGDAPVPTDRTAKASALGGAHAPAPTAMAHRGGFFEGFDGVADGSIPDGWTQFEAGTGTPGGPAWGAVPYDPSDASLGKAARVGFENVDSGLAVDYLVTPSLSIGTGFILTATLYEGTPSDFGSTYQIRVSTTNRDDATSFSGLIGNFNEADLPIFGSASAPVTLDLSAYDGMDIFIAFVLTNDDGDDFYVDDVSVAPRPTGPVASVTPIGIDFGRVGVGTTASETVTVTNVGTSLLTVSSLDVVSTSTFGIDASLFDATLEPGESSSFLALFSPDADTDFLGDITVNSDDPESPASVLVTGIGVSPPPNDNLIDALPTSGGGIYEGSNEFATIELDEVVPSCQDDQGASLWYRYTSDTDVTVYLDLSRSNFDTILSVYDGGTDAEVACDDDSGVFLTSRLPAVPVTAGTEYFFRAAGFDGTSLGGFLSTGDVVLQVEAYDGAASETSGFSRAIDPGTGFNRPQADGDGTPGSCLPSTDEVSYDTVNLTVGANGVYDVTATWGGFDGYLLLYEGSFDPALPCVGLLGRDDDHDPGSGDVEDGSQIADIFLYGSGSSGRGGPEYTLVATTFGPGDSGPYDIESVGTGPVMVSPVASEGAPDGTWALSVARPNPTARSFHVDLSLSSPEAVRVSVVDVLGREVAVVHTGSLAAGTTTLRADIEGLPSGRYLIRAVGATVRETRALTVVR